MLKEKDIDMNMFYYKNNYDSNDISETTDKEEIVIRSMNRSTDPEKVKEIVIFAQPNGDLIRLKDIADVRLDFTEIPYKNFINGNRGISFIIKKTSDEDLDKIANEMDNFIEKFNK